MHTARISPRPLTDQEWSRIERARAHVDTVEAQAREQVRRAWADYDAEIAAAVLAGASQTEIAARLGVRRQAVHLAFKRAAESD